MKPEIKVDIYARKYFLNGVLHREDGPAVEYHNNGGKVWYQNGLIHRLDGPALEYSDGTNDWYYKGQLIECDSQEEFEKLIKLLAFI